MPIVERKVIPDGVVYFDCWKGYARLDVMDFKHHRINHLRLLRMGGTISTVSGIFGTRRNVIRENSMVFPRAHFGLFLQECGWRYNNNDPRSQLLRLKQLVGRVLY